MQKANLKKKPNSVFCTVAKPTTDTPRQWREVQGAFMEHDSQENIDSWWGVFTEMATECTDFKRPRNRNRHRH